MITRLLVEVFKECRCLKRKFKLTEKKKGEDIGQRSIPRFELGCCNQRKQVISVSSANGTIILATDKSRVIYLFVSSAFLFSTFFITFGGIKSVSLGCRKKRTGRGSLLSKRRQNN